MSQNSEFKTVTYKKDRPNSKEILDKVASGDLSTNDADRMLNNRQRPRFVVIKGGKIALFNLDNTPIILYADQWEKLSSMIERDILKNYISRNENILKRRKKYNQESENPDVEQ